MRHPALRLLLAAVAVLTVLAGCGGDESELKRGEAATWEVDPERPPQPTDMKVLALVSRVECAGGRTGRVLAPVVKEDDQRVVVTYTVERTPNKDATCPGNRPSGQTLHSGAAAWRPAAVRRIVPSARGRDGLRGPAGLADQAVSAYLLNPSRLEAWPRLRVRWPDPVAH